MMANKADFDLWRHTVRILKSLTGAEIYNEDDEKIDDIFKEYNDARIDEIICRDYNLLKVMIKHYKGEPVCIHGLLREAYIGKWLLAHLDIEKLPDKHAVAILHQWFNDLNWETYIYGKVGTRSNVAVKKPDSDYSGRISLFAYDEHGTEYSYISHAELFGIRDERTGDIALIEYDNLEDILPSSWEKIDDRQYAVHPLTPSEFNDFMAAAKKYNII